MRDRPQQSLTNLLFERQLAPCNKNICSRVISEQSSRCIESWAEGDALKRCSATYCQLNPPPRSTIAAAFSPDGKLVASTHGDHTVKVICVGSGKCLQTLTGHRRTPWVVRFHPSSSSLLASGSLDYEVRLWNAHTAECINVHNFGRPIASLAFHIEGDALAVASGHKLYMWQYTKQQQGEDGAPPVALKTRRSLRAVHFHPLGLPLVLTAEVNDVSAPVTLPFGVTAPPPPVSPPQPPNPMPGSSIQAGVPPDEEPSRQLSLDIAVNSDRTRSEVRQNEWPVERRAPRRLSEVFRALMEEEREEELLAQLESSASLQASSAQTSASRQILGLTHHSQAQLHRPQGPRASGNSLSHRASGGLGSLPHPPVPIRQQRPPSRPRSYHPLRHSIDADSTAFNASSTMQPMATPFGTTHTEADGSFSSVTDAVSAGQDPARDNVIQQRARAWARQRQQEQSVLSQPDSSELRIPLRSQSGLPDAAGSRTRSPQQSSSQPGHDTWRPQQSPRGGAPLPHTSGLSKRQSEPSTSIDEEWPALGTPPVTLHLLHGPSLHLPPPSPVNAPRQTPQQAAAATQTPAAFGLQWAANLARGAEWMGEATGLRFLTRPFSRTVAGMTGSAAVASEDSGPAQGGHDIPSTSTSHQVLLDGGASPLPQGRASPMHRASMEQQVSALAPSHGSMSYRERLLAGSNGQQSSAKGQTTRQNMVRISPSKQPPQGSQVGFPSQQELQATHSASPQPSSSSSAAAGLSSPSVPAVSALSLRHESQSGAAAEAHTPAGQQSSSSAAFASDNHTAPHAVSVLPEAAQDVSQPQSSSDPPDSAMPAPHAASGQLQDGAPQGLQRGFPIGPAEEGSGLTRRPMHLGAESQGTASLPPSMLNMGWEYPAHLLQGPDPLPPSRGRDRTARGEASQQPNNAVANAVRYEVAAAAANIIGTEQPCRVRLRLWHCSADDPTASLEVPSLTIPDAVLCSEMGVHFSTCGRFLAACVACQAGHPQDMNADAVGIIYEVRVYSLEAPTLGEVLHARQIKAAHCLTSVQFSPTSEHLLLAYGRRHISLLRSLVPDGTSSIIPVHTILEVYQVSDMSLVCVLPSAEDEVNAAAFHPHPAGGIAYGTKEGKLRILHHDPRPEARTLATCQQPRGLQDELREAESLYEDDVLL